MHKFKMKKAKTKITIIAFSLLVMVTFIGVLFLFINSSKQLSPVNDGIYVISSAEYFEMLKGDGTIRIDPSKFTTAGVYNNQIINKLLIKLIPLAGLFLLIIFVLASCLWNILKKMQQKSTIKMIQQLNDVANGIVITEDVALNKTYLLLRQKFDDHLDDYKRLNSYLSHDQKNAIAILRTNLELSGNKEYLKNLDFISDSIDNILTLSESDDSTPLGTVDVSLVCAEVCDVYKKINKQIIFDFDEFDETEILAKKRWIYRATANLIDNAIKYGNNNPIIVSVKAKNNAVIITVKDKGIGMSNKKQEIIFDHHYRINELNQNGYGIGLSLVSHVCDLCGGFVMVDSEIDKGSTFYLSFPQK